MSNNQFEALIYRITGDVVSDKITVSTEVGTTYNFIESIPHLPITFDIAKNAKHISYQDAVAKVFDIVQENKALSSVVVEDIVDVLQLIFEVAPKSIIDFDAIKNREVKIRLLIKLDKPITSDIVYNVLFFKITGRTQYIRTFREFRRSTLSRLPIESDLAHFIELNRKSLAEYYRRNRSLLLYVKNNFFANNEKMRKVINSISKASRHVNKPTSNKKFKNVPLDKKPTSELLKMLYASKTITIRNGLTYTVESRSDEPYPKAEILDVLRTRDDIFTDEQLALIDDGWDLALPSSAKRAAGIVPNGSSIEIKPGQSFGLRWYDDLSASPYVDLDLSFTTASRRYGWNADKTGEVTYSGDMTSMQKINSTTQSAMETFTINDVNLMGVLDVASYNFGGNTTKVEFIIGDIALPIEKPTSATVLGYIVNNRFYINVDNHLNAKATLSEVQSSTVTDGTSFRDIRLTDIYKL